MTDCKKCDDKGYIYRGNSRLIICECWAGDDLQVRRSLKEEENTTQMKSPYKTALQISDEVNKGWGDLKNLITAAMSNRDKIWKGRVADANRAGVSALEAASKSYKQYEETIDRLQEALGKAVDSLGEYHERAFQLDVPSPMRSWTGSIRQDLKRTLAALEISSPAGVFLQPASDQPGGAAHEGHASAGDPPDCTCDVPLCVPHEDECALGKWQDEHDAQLDESEAQKENQSLPPITGKESDEIDRAFGLKTLEIADLFSNFLSEYFELTEKPDPEGFMLHFRHWGFALSTPAEAATITALRAQLNRQVPVVAAAVELEKPYLTLFLDGRNEHGSHTLIMPGDNIGEPHLKDIKAQLEDDRGALAEEIISEAETLGYAVGQVVVTLWIFEAGGFDYGGISVPLTVLLKGSYAAQELAVRAMEEKE